MRLHVTLRGAMYVVSGYGARIQIGSGVISPAQNALELERPGKLQSTHHIPSISHLLMGDQRSAD